jgi:VanZ family protein
MVPDDNNARRILFYAALASAAFVIYGSLLPFDFHLRSLHDIRLAILGAGTSLVSISLTDRLVNVLLSVPIAFFAFGSASRPGKGVRNLFTAFLVFTFCGLLAAAIEFLQLFLPTRTSSLADIIAQSIGAILGVVLWAFVGGPVLKTFTLLSMVKPVALQLTRRSKRLIWVAAISYFALLLVINGWFTSSWLPLNVAADKARNLHLAPFYYDYFANFFLSVYSVCTNFIL